MWKILLVALSVSTGAYASDLPYLDIDARCHEMHPDNAMGERACRLNEQQYYDLLKVMWPSTIDRTRRYCMTFIEKSRLYSPVSRCVLEMRDRDNIETQGPFQH